MLTDGGSGWWAVVVVSGWLSGGVSGLVVEVGSDCAVWW